METKNENSDVSRAEEMKNQANEAFKGLLLFLKTPTESVLSSSLSIACYLQVTSSPMLLICIQKL